MPHRAWVATRKGLIELHRAPEQAWQIVRTSFLGEPVSMVLTPQPDGPHRGRMLAALNLGHFGVKLHASDDEGLTWTEVAVPVYPAQPERAAGPPWKLVLVWALGKWAWGPIIAMLANYRSDLVWKYMRKSPYIIRGLRRAGFAGGWLDQAP